MEILKVLIQIINQEKNIIGRAQLPINRTFATKNAVQGKVAKKVVEKKPVPAAKSGAEKTAKEVFSDNSLGLNLPSIVINKKSLKHEIDIIELIIISKLETSKSEIRRLIKGNAIKINNELINGEKFSLNKKMSDRGFIKLSIGKKRHLKVEFN